MALVLQKPLVAAIKQEKILPSIEQDAYSPAWEQVGCCVFFFNMTPRSCLSASPDRAASVVGGMGGPPELVLPPDLTPSTKCTG